MSACCKRGCCCCCNKRDFSVLFGFILAAIAVAVPIVIHETNHEYGLIVLKFIRQYLSQAEGRHEGIGGTVQDDQTQPQSLEPGQKYK